MATTDPDKAARVARALERAEQIKAFNNSAAGARQRAENTARLNARSSPRLTTRSSPSRLGLGPTPGEVARSKEAAKVAAREVAEKKAAERAAAKAAAGPSRFGVGITTKETPRLASYRSRMGGGKGMVGTALKVGAAAAVLGLGAYAVKKS